MPYSGPVSAYGAIGRAQLAYFRMINDQGGINGRKINLISLDDGYSPPKTVEQIRRLVEQDEVAFIFQSLGDVTNAAVQRYLNERHIPRETVPNMGVLTVGAWKTGGGNGMAGDDRTERRRWNEADPRSCPRWLHRSPFDA